MLHFKEWLDNNIKMIIIATIITLKNLLKILKIKRRKKFMCLGSDQLRTLQIFLSKQKNQLNILLLLKRKEEVLSNILKGKYGLDKKCQRKKESQSRLDAVSEKINTYNRLRKIRNKLDKLTHISESFSVNI